MTGIPKQPRNAEVVGKDGQFNQSFARYWDSIARRAGKSMLNFESLTAGTIDPTTDYVAFYDASEGTTGYVLAEDLAASVPADEFVSFTSSGTFTKASYPTARQFVVTAIGPGGNGSGDDGDSGGAGGQAGGVAIKRFVPSDLAASITVTINSSKAEFAHTTAVVGNAGAAAEDGDRGTGAGTATGGDQNFTGPGGGPPSEYFTSGSSGGQGGTPLGTMFGRGGMGGRGDLSGGGNSSENGDAGAGYGGGGGGGGAKPSTPSARSGGTGAPGAVFVEVRY